MHLQRIAELLAPFLNTPLSDAQLSQLAGYLEILHRWNARINLTAIHDPEQIVTRHFGESLFTAQHLFPQSLESGAQCLIDVGSGAGFPGLPIKIWAPDLPVTLIESQNKKATFLREVIRALELKNISVSTARAEEFDSHQSAGAPPAARRTTITLRAVEKFERVLPVAARLAAGGRLALLIGSLQVAEAHRLAPTLRWAEPLPIPHSLARVLLVGESS
jgi:16S rRNA (guanine527-N7)-methyltransferase